MVHVSLDGMEQTHDAFRGVTGSFRRTIGIIENVRALGIPLQIGSTVTRLNVRDLPAMADLLQKLDIQVWNVFFLVPTGRGQRSDMLDALETEVVLQCGPCPNECPSGSVPLPPSTTGG